MMAQHRGSYGCGPNRPRQTSRPAGHAGRDMHSPPLPTVSQLWAPSCGHVGLPSEAMHLVRRRAMGLPPTLAHAFSYSLTGK